MLGSGPAYPPSLRSALHRNAPRGPVAGRLLHGVEGHYQLAYQLSDAVWLHRVEVARVPSTVLCPFTFDAFAARRRLSKDSGVWSAPEGCIVRTAGHTLIGATGGTPRVIWLDPSTYNCLPQCGHLNGLGTRRIHVCPQWGHVLLESFEPFFAFFRTLTTHLATS